ncbi:hypothetical protein EV368DRAFT_63020 [Lentinula lateritia]|nr:hypothetical protein EV368DRAFT_63020 [Lentinula lateritia]
MKCYAILYIIGALLAAATNALPTRIAERQPTRQFGGSRPPPNSPHLAHYNGTGNGGDDYEDDPENDSASYTSTFSCTSTTSAPTSTSTDETAMESSSDLPLPVETLTQTQSILKGGGLLQLTGGSRERFRVYRGVTDMAIMRPHTKFERQWLIQPSSFESTLARLNDQPPISQPEQPSLLLITHVEFTNDIWHKLVDMSLTLAVETALIGDFLLMLLYYQEELERGGHWSLVSFCHDGTRLDQALL